MKTDINNKLKLSSEKNTSLSYSSAEQFAFSKIDRIAKENCEKA
ncbi:MAG: hypothetical protein Q8N63_06720 [Nanoarchaeota archaeon]|nr:hypothetical protein [Nanoarchaeota archaeon]